MSGEEIRFFKVGGSKFSSIIFSKPDPIEHIKKSDGIIL